MSARRWKIWGWGREGEGLEATEERRLLQFYAERLGVADRPGRPAPRIEEVDLRAPRILSPPVLAHLCSTAPYERLLHTYGKSFPNAVLAFMRNFNEAPDVVATPRSETDVTAILDWAGAVGAAVIPFGGGSSVAGGVDPAVGDGFAGTISLDLKGLDQILEVDRTSRAARIQGGILGPALEAALKPYGLTLRHFPQSFEFSTLGGWIATRSGGHFATLYTHIDDFVESLRVVTPAGVLESRRLPGSGAGPSPDRLIIGSEGALGVITEAWMRLQDRPRFRAGAAVAFDDLVAGARAVRAVAQAGLYPSNLRLVDAAECGANGVGDGSFALLVLAFESADHPVDAWQARALELVQDQGGRALADAGAAEAWRTAFIRMPYQREVLVPRDLIVDTFETAITWDRFEAFHHAVKSATEQAILEATGRAGLVTCRFTHVYPDGPAPYFSLHAAGREGALLEQWREIKDRASDAVIDGGGTITHHHAVGRDHMPWYRRQRPALFGAALAAAKRTLDPAGILNPGVLLPVERR
ncbi:MAG: FAD-binding oxidoreductase [Geminicoccaceae bacterium]